jgi:hypothetical protein
MKNTKKNYRKHNNQTKKGGILKKDDITEYIEIYKKYEKVENHSSLEKIETELIKKVLDNIPQPSVPENNDHICLLETTVYSMFEKSIQENIEPFQKKIVLYNNLVDIQHNLVNQILVYVERYLKDFNVKTGCNEEHRKIKEALSESEKVTYKEPEKKKLPEALLDNLLIEIIDEIIKVLIVFIENFNIGHGILKTYKKNPELIDEDDLLKIKNHVTKINYEKITPFFEQIMNQIIKKDVCNTEHIDKIQKHIRENNEKITAEVRKLWSFVKPKDDLVVDKLYERLFFNIENPKHESIDVSTNCLSSTTNYLDYQTIRGLLWDMTNQVCLGDKDAKF